MDTSTIQQYFLSKDPGIINTLSLELAEKKINLKSDVFVAMGEFLTSSENKTREEACYVLYRVLLNLKQMEMSLECEESVRSIF